MSWSWSKYKNQVSIVILKCTEVNFHVATRRMVVWARSIHLRYTLFTTQGVQLSGKVPFVGASKGIPKVWGFLYSLEIVRINKNVSPLRNVCLTPQEMYSNSSKGLRIVLSSENLNWYNGHAAGCTQRYHFLLNRANKFCLFDKDPRATYKVLSSRLYNYF